MKEMKIDDVKVEKEKRHKEPAPHVKAAQIEKEAVRALSVDEAEAQTASVFGPNDKEWVIPNGPEEQLAALEINLKRLQGDNAILRTEIADLHQENGLLEGELADAKKTISKMQQEHAAEVQDLKDKLDEARADAAVAKKNHARAVGEKNDYAYALDNDSIAFERILSLAGALQRNAQTGLELARIIEAETEGRI